MTIPAVVHVGRSMPTTRGRFEFLTKGRSSETETCCEGPSAVIGSDSSTPGCETDGHEDTSDVSVDTSPAGNVEFAVVASDGDVTGASLSGARLSDDGVVSEASAPAISLCERGGRVEVAVCDSSGDADDSSSADAL